LAFLPDRTSIPPLIESDYCYLLTAADRLHDGFGLTTTQPVAPLQSWSWQYEWGFLTNWPVGYSIIVCAIRSVFHQTAIEACRWISIVACAAALVGWFVFIRRSVPPGIAGVLLAAVAAASAVPVASLTNPSTDALVVAALPFLLLLITDDRRTLPRLAMAGLIAGSLFWIRYASVFVPVAVGSYLLIEALRRRVAVRGVVGFAVTSAFPIATLLVINGVYGSSDSAQAQLNLGTTAGFEPSFNHFARAWWVFTDLGFYDYHAISRWVSACWPIGVVLCATCIPRLRKKMLSFLATKELTLSVMLVVMLLAMLIAATTVFGGKFDYVGLDRYYLPIKPFYFLLFVTPLMLIPRRVVRAGLCLALVVAGSWTVQQEWSRDYHRQLAANRVLTPYGQWSRCFEPGATQLYSWLRKQNAPNLIVISNFHEYITLETKIPTLPIPPDETALNQWIERICSARGMTGPRILFVLDPSNRWRDYWVAKPDDVVQTFRLLPYVETPPTAATYVYEYSVRPELAAVSP